MESRDRGLNNYSSARKTNALNYPPNPRSSALAFVPTLTSDMLGVELFDEDEVEPPDPFELIRPELLPVEEDDGELDDDPRVRALTTFIFWSMISLRLCPGLS